MTCRKNQRRLMPSAAAASARAFQLLRMATIKPKTNAKIAYATAPIASAVVTPTTIVIAWGSVTPRIGHNHMIAFCIVRSSLARVHAFLLRGRGSAGGVDQAILIPTARKQNTVNCVSRYGRRQSLITGGAAANAICRREGAVGPATAVTYHSLMT